MAASCSLTTRTSKRSRSPEATSPAGAAFQDHPRAGLPGAPGGLERLVLGRLALEQQRSAAPRLSPSICEAATLALAPAATTMAFSPAPETAMKAAPVGASTSATRERSTPSPPEQRQGDPAEGVLADRAHERHLRAGATGGERLVRAFPAGDHGVVGAHHGLARRRDALHAGDEIHVDGAEHHDHDAALRHAT